MTLRILGFPFSDGFQGHADVDVDGIEGVLPITGDLNVSGDLTVGDDATITGSLVAGVQSVIGVGAAPTDDVALTLMAPGLDDTTFHDFFAVKAVAGNAAGTGFGEFAQAYIAEGLNVQNLIGMTFSVPTVAGHNHSGFAGITGTSYAGNGPPAATTALWSYGGTVGADRGQLALGVTNGAGTGFNYFRFSIVAADNTIKFSMGAAAPTARSAVAALTNNVTAGGANNTIANYADLAVYANDAAAIRNDIYQLARKVAELTAVLRQHGIVI